MKASGIKVSKLGLYVLFIFIILLSSQFIQSKSVLAQSSSEGVWVLSETQVNPLEVPLEYYGGGSTPGYFEEARFDGKFTVYWVSETSFGINDREVDHGYEYHNVSVETSFDKPPTVLTPGESIELEANFSHSGTSEDGGVAVLFWYFAEGLDVDPSDPFSYAPWYPNFPGTNNITYTIEIPSSASDGEFEIGASWWNAGANLVVWKYVFQEGGVETVEEVAPAQNADGGDYPSWLDERIADVESRGQEIELPSWLDWIKPHETNQPIRGIVKPIFGDAYIYNVLTKEFRGPVKSGEFIHAGEIVMVGDDASAEIYAKGSEWFDVIRITDMASIQYPRSPKETDYPTLWTLYSGAIRAKRIYTGEQMPAEDSDIPGFHMTDIQGCLGVRSEFVYLYEPTVGLSLVYLIEGNIDYYNLVVNGDEDGSIVPGQSLLILEDGTEIISEFEEENIQTFLETNNLENGFSLDLEEIEALFEDSIVEEPPERASTSNSQPFIILGIVCGVIFLLLVVVLIAFFLIRRSKKKNE